MKRDADHVKCQPGDMNMSRATESPCGRQAPQCAEPCRNDLALDRFPAIIGRGGQADIHLKDRWVSRRHCEITEIDGALVVRDLGSTHGTLLNGARVEESPLGVGDQLTLGLTTLIVSAESCISCSAAGNAQAAAGRLVLVRADARCEENGATDRIARSKPR